MIFPYSYFNGGEIKVFQVIDHITIVINKMCYYLTSELNLYYETNACGMVGGCQQKSSPMILLLAIH